MTGFPVTFIDHNVSEAGKVIVPHRLLRYNNIIGGRGKGMEVIFHRAADVKMAVMIVDEDWRLKFSSAIVRAGQGKLFTPCKELKIVKHFAELNIVCDEMGGLIIKDVSKANILGQTNGLSTLDGHTLDFYNIVEGQSSSSSSQGAPFDTIASGGFTGFDRK
ncbi:hypothetical protein L484_020614 [Morus notabilis]|uniref:Uncharacterized protein n=1 Tax=Morus notabilis TaxID=981085 RepID=W9SH48_9ROSA|nr:hypothetical protein L484_020614 [Morus notabilis]